MNKIESASTSIYPKSIQHDVASHLHLASFVDFKNIYKLFSANKSFTQYLNKHKEITSEKEVSGKFNEFCNKALKASYMNKINTPFCLELKNLDGLELINVMSFLKPLDIFNLSCADKIFNCLGKRLLKIVANDTGIDSRDGVLTKIMRFSYDVLRAPSLGVVREYKIYSPQLRDFFTFKILIDTSEKMQCVYPGHIHEMVAVRTDGHFFDGKKVTEKFEGTCVHKSILFEGLRADFCWGTKNAKCEYIIAGKFNILVHERNSRELIIAGIQREVSNLFFQNDGESKCWFDSIPNSNHQN